MKSEIIVFNADPKENYPWELRSHQGGYIRGYQSLEDALEYAPDAVVSAHGLQQYRLAIEAKLQKRIVI